MTDVNILKTGSDLLTFLSKRWWILLLCLAIGLTIGYIRGAGTPNIYKTQLIGETKGISNVSVVGVLNALQSSSNTNNYALLSEQTGINKKITQTIYALEAEIYVNTNPTENLNNNVFYITVSTSDLTQMPLFIKGLERYINNNKLFKGRGEAYISDEFDQPTQAQNNILITLLKYGLVFFVLGVVIAIGVNFVVNVNTYRKSIGSV